MYKLMSVNHSFFPILFNLGFPLAIEDIFNKAKQAANSGNYTYAIDLFREVLRHEPEHPEARVLLRGTERKLASKNAGIVDKIKAYIKVTVSLLKAQLTFKDSRKKLECYEDALEVLPDNTSFAIRASKAARASGLTAAAIIIVKDVVRRAPENERALRQAGLFLEEAGDKSEALKFLNRLHKIDPSDVDIAAKVKNLEAEVHMESSKMQEAESFRDMIKDEDAAQESVKKFETEDEKRAKQIAQVFEALKDEPENKSKIIRLASMLQQSGNTRKALKLLKDARQKFPDDYDIREKLGDMQIRNLEKKERTLHKKLEDAPENTEVKEKLAEINKKRKDLNLRELKWRVEKHPTDKELKLELGRALYESEDIDGAIGAFQQAGQVPQLELEAATMLGKCFAWKNQCDLAVEQFKRALSRHDTMDRKGMDLYYNLASALEADGESEEALQIYKRLYSHDIGFRDVADKVEKLKNNV